MVSVTFSNWVALIVPVGDADGGIRFCADFSTGPIAAFNGSLHPLPSPKDIFINVNGGAYFVKLDPAEAYF